MPEETKNELPKLDKSKPFVLAGDGEKDLYYQDGFVFDIQGRYIGKITENNKAETVVKEFYSCDICGKEFDSKSGLEGHKAWHLTKPKTKRSKSK